MIFSWFGGVGEGECFGLGKAIQGHCVGHGKIILKKKTTLFLPPLELASFTSFFFALLALIFLFE